MLLDSPPQKKDPFYVFCGRTFCGRMYKTGFGALKKAQNQTEEPQTGLKLTKKAQNQASEPQTGLKPSKTAQNQASNSPKDPF